MTLRWSGCLGQCGHFTRPIPAQRRWHGDPQGRSGGAIALAGRARTPQVRRRRAPATRLAFACLAIDSYLLLSARTVWSRTRYRTNKTTALPALGAGGRTAQSSGVRDLAVAAADRSVRSCRAVWCAVTSQEEPGGLGEAAAAGWPGGTSSGDSRQRRATRHRTFSTNRASAPFAALHALLRCPTDLASTART